MPPVILFAVSVLLLVSSSILITAWLRLPTRAAYLISVYLWVVANIVMGTQIAGTLGFLDSRLFFLALQAGSALGAAALWHAAGRPALAGPFAARPVRLDRKARRQAAQRWPELVILMAAVAVIFAFQAVLALAIPQNIDDVLTTHLARVGYWLQSGSLKPWDTSDYNLPQVTYPLNLSAQLLWSVLFWGNDQLVGLVQWLAALVAMVAIFGLARQLRASQPQALFIAFLWLTLPGIALQTTHALTDLMATALFVAALYLLFLGMETKHRGALVLSGISLGLAVGVRQAIIFAFPGLGLAAAIIGWHDRGRLPLLVGWGTACITGFLLLGAYIYIANFAHFHHPFGPPESFSAYTRTEEKLTLPRRGEYLLKNGIYSTAFWTVTILPGDLASPLLSSPIKKLQAIGSDLDPKWLNPLGHGYAWFGLVGLLLFPKMLRRGVSHKSDLGKGLFVIGVSTIVLLAASRNFSVAMSRYLILPLSVMIPLTASIYRPGRASFWLVVLSIVTLLWTVGSDSSKRAISLPAMLRHERAENQTLFMLNSSEILPAFDHVAPKDATVGLFVEQKFPHSPLFGREFTRKVEVFHQAPPVIDRAWFEHAAVNVVILDTRDFTPRIDDSVCVVKQSLSFILIVAAPPDSQPDTCLDVE